MEKSNLLWSALAFSLLFILSQNALADQVHALKVSQYEMETGNDGYSRILMDGYHAYGVPGYPDLPSKIFRFVVPPDVVEKTIGVEYTVTSSSFLGQFKFRELPPMATWDDEKKIESGKTGVYAKNTALPERSVEFIGSSKMRKWRFITIRYTPFQYNPITQGLIYNSEVKVNITYTRKGMNSLPKDELTDTVMDKRAKKAFANYDEGKSWYESSRPSPGAGATYDYVIITTNAIESASTKLAEFLSHLQGKGFSPLVITEDEYGGLTGQSPDGTAEKIRQWLIGNYLGYGITYVLLIGNPDPDDPGSATDAVGDVPMKMCWPKRYDGSYQESPTDYFYADLTGNWDLDGDGYFGEYCDVGLSCGTGHGDVNGVDFANEVYVGRIPVYTGGTANLDAVLEKTIAYHGESDISWRKTALLPMSFSDASTDGAYLSEAMMNNYLTGAGMFDWTLYMQGSVCAAANSAFASDQELIDDASWQNWRDNDYGMVWWWGHGSQSGASLGYTGCGWGGIIDSADTQYLDNTHPAHVYQNSCLNGYPETGSATPAFCNLGTALLYNGAITTTSASRVSWYAITSWFTGLKYYCDNASIGYYYGQELVVNRKTAAMALYDVKADMGANLYGYWDGSHWMNLMDFNLYGDPSVSLYEKFTETSEKSVSPAVYMLLTAD